MAYKINHANIKEWAKNYEGEPFDAILCDPPYELGFMGKSWDSSGIAFDTWMWAELFRHIKPGGHLLAFSGSRTYHRMAVAIEDAGFEIRDMIEWVYGSGFPKSLNIGKAVDKIQGNERETEKHHIQSKTNPDIHAGGQVHITMPNNWEVTKGTSPYEGYGTALKPAHEPCVLARKPIEGTVANNVLKHGTGGLNIDGSRVGHNDPIKETNRSTWTGGAIPVQSSDKKIINTNTLASANPTGRFPANLIHDGSDEVVGLFPDTGKSSSSMRGAGGGGDKVQQLNYRADSLRGHNDNGGSAARFFYCAKAGKSERNAGLEGFEVKDPDIRSDTAKGSYTSKGIAPQTNYHPTVKPLSLTKYLATLIKPPTGGRLLVPFSGSGSEMIGALQAGWEYVEGVELTEEYIPIAEARIKYWLDKMSKEQLEML